MTVKEAVEYMKKEAVEHYSNEDVADQAIKSIEENGIVFIDEIDKICRNPRDINSTDASSEGVQRDLLPLIEGTVINTKYGDVDTSKILFIASGAFYSVSLEIQIIIPSIFINFNCKGKS